MPGSQTILRVKWVYHTSFKHCNRLVIVIQKNKQKHNFTDFLANQLDEETANLLFDFAFNVSPKQIVY